MLVVDDEPENLEMIGAALAGEHLNLVLERNAESALERVKEFRPRIVLSDLRLPGMDGFEFLERVLAVDPGTDFMLMTGFYSPESAVDAIRRGACDYFSKPLDIKRLQCRIRGLLEEAGTRHKSFQLDQELIGAYQFEGMLGRSPLMLDVFAKIRRIAPHFRTVLIQGATGTGKELVANALHNLSATASSPFAVCNCAALMDSLLEVNCLDMCEAPSLGPLTTSKASLNMRVAELSFWMKSVNYLWLRRPSFCVCCRIMRFNG